MERLVGHDELHEPLEQRVVGVGVQVGEGAHRQPLQQHLHADQLFVDERRAHDVGQEVAEQLPHRIGRAPAHLDIAAERGDVPRFLARLVGGIFLRARVQQDVAERGR